MTPDQYFTPLKGQSLLYPGQANKLRGQCVQSVMLWLQALGVNPPVYEFAYEYYQNGIPGYTKIPVGPNIQTGDIIVWGSNFPASPGAGHIDVAAASGTLQSFYAWDSNWSPPLELNRILHNGNDNNYIVGYLRRQDMPDPNQMNQLVFFCWGPGAATPADMEKINSQASVQFALSLILGDDRTARWYTQVNNLIDQPSSVVPYSGPQLFEKAE